MKVDLSHIRYAIVGAGSMAEAILRGMLMQKIAKPEQIFITNNSNKARLEELHNQYGVIATNELTVKNEYIANADVVIMAMKPKDVPTSFPQLKQILNNEQLLVSVIAGLSIHAMGSLLDYSMPIARTMPNTSSTIGLGATGISFSNTVSDEQKEIVLAIFNAVGIVTVVDEPLIETVTGLSGSGPAYVYYMMEALAIAGVEGGLSEESARELALQTVLGAAHMVKSTGEDPAELRRKVCSPGGATLAAIEKLDQYSFREAISQAATRSAERAKEMGEAINAAAKIPAH